MYDPFVFGVALGFAFLAFACAIDLFKSLLNAEKEEERAR
jgi:hypothetical protein